MRTRTTSAALLVLCISLTQVGSCAARPLQYTGVNIAGGEFYDPVRTPQPVYGRDFSYPTAGEFDYFARKGMNIFRITFLWETLQPAVRTPFRPEEAARLAAVVREATGRGLTVILDPHNYARYYGKVVGGPDVSAEDFADFWGRMAHLFRGNSRVWFGLVNEPHDMPTGQWLTDANAAIAAIRAAGARNRVLVPGNNWTGASGWMDGGDNANAVWMQRIRDPGHNFLFEVHQYLDFDNSGSHFTVVSPTIGSDRIQAFTQWCRQHHYRAFLGEFAVPATETGRAALDNLLGSMERNRDVWEGFAWWAAGARWGNYPFSIEPRDGVDKPQLAYLIPHLKRGS